MLGIPRSLEWRNLKKTPALIPLLAVIAAGGALAGGFVIRTATQAPEASWRKKKNPEPWNEYSTKQFKLYSVMEPDLKTAAESRPKF